MEMASCGWVRRFIGPWKDGELDPTDAARIESHIAGCPACATQAKFERWFSDEVRRLVDRPQAPARLADRISLELRREHRRQRVRRVAFAFGGLAAAAGLAAVVAFSLRGAPPAQPPDGPRAAVSSETGAGGVAPSTPPAPPGFVLTGRQDGDLLGPDLVDHHERTVGRAVPLSLASSSADEVSTFFRDKVPFPVAPPSFSDADGTLLGGRMVNVRGQDAAYLGYTVHGHPVSLFVLSSSAAPVVGERASSVANRTVFTSHRGGLTYAMFRWDGLIYALVSDLPESMLVQLAAQVP